MPATPAGSRPSSQPGGAPAARGQSGTGAPPAAQPASATATTPAGQPSGGATGPGGGQSSGAAPTPVGQTTSGTPASGSAAPSAGPAGGPAAGGTSAQPQSQRLRIFDTHLHYSQDAWGSFPVERILALLDEAGIERALISSTPDDGTLQLYEQAPDRIVPILRPYRTRDDMGRWTRDPDVLAYVEERLEKRPYRGIGEFHLSRGEARNPVTRAFVDLALQRDLFLHAHANDDAVEELLQVRPGVKVLWAHAGMSASPAVIGGLVERYPTLWVELALRSDVASGGRLDPAWEALFRRFPDRFMLGTDTWVPSRWPQVPEVAATSRAWLRQLPPDLAEQIAYGNAERLFLK